MEPECKLQLDGAECKLQLEGVVVPAKHTLACQAGCRLPALQLQAALQNKRMEFRSSVAEGIKGIFQRQDDGGEAAAAAAAPGATASGRAGGLEGEEAVWVHEGFLEAYASVRPVVLRLLDTVLAGEAWGAVRSRGHGRWKAR